MQAVNQKFMDHYCTMELAKNFINSLVAIFIVATFRIAENVFGMSFNITVDSTWDSVVNFVANNFDKIGVCATVYFGFMKYRIALRRERREEADRLSKMEKEIGNGDNSRS